jgi:putative ABC transport system substrate-binding protein
MTRRDCVGLFCSAALLSFAANAQQADRIRRVGVLMGVDATDAEGQARLAAFMQGLQENGWSVGRNLRTDIRWTGGKPSDIRKYAAELVAFAPDVILASGGTVLGSLLQATHTIPVVFTLTPDPVGAGFVESLAKPGGNATGFTNLEYGQSGKWLELLKQIAPNVTRVAVLRDPVIAQGIGQFGAIQSAAPSLGLVVTPINVRDVGEMERAVAAFARSENGGLIVPGSGAAVAQRSQIIALAARYRLPAVYPIRAFAADGGLTSYGPDTIEPHRRAAGYVDRVLKGEKPGDLPVQAPTKYELVINLKTAKTLGLTVAPSLLATASEVIE